MATWKRMATPPSFDERVEQARTGLGQRSDHRRHVRMGYVPAIDLDLISGAAHMVSDKKRARRLPGSY